jgi:uncharacterized membrane protein
MPKSRTEAFSDGVFAIAITLLVLEIKIPESEYRDLWHAIVHEWPAYLGYATSFLTIGGIWLAHHGIFRRLAFVNTRVMRLNLGLLMAVAFLPFPTGLVAGAIRDRDAERAAVVFYGLTLLATALLNAALWGSVVIDRHLVRTDVTDEEVRAITLATTPSVVFYGGAILLGLLSPRIAALLYLLIAILGVLRARGDRDGSPPGVTGPA